MKRLLFISPHVPYPPTEGGTIRSYGLLRALHRDWDVHYIAFQVSGQPLSKDHGDQLCTGLPGMTLETLDEMAKIREKLGVAFLRPLFWIRRKLKTFDNLRPLFWIMNLPFVLQMDRRIRQVIRNKLHSQHFDAVLLDYTKMAQYLSVIKDKRVKKIINVHNAESDNSRQLMLSHGKGLGKAIYWLQWKLFEIYERHFIPKCDLLLAPSQADAEFYHRLAANIKTAVIPNAVDTEALRTLSPPDEPFSLIYPGRMDYPPNAQAVCTFCKEILPRTAQAIPSVRLYIVGKNPPLSVQRLNSDRVVVTGYVEDILPFWQKTSVLVVPLKMGGGTRIKILEAMALGRPVVSTSKGCEGLDVVHGTHILIADDPEKFANDVTRLLQDPSLHDGLTLAARKLVEERYSFAALEPLLREVLENGAS